MKFLVVLFALTMFWQCEGKKLSRCELVRELRKHRFEENKMRDWVCLVENESSRQTQVVSKPNSDGSRDYGLFQINSRYWCSTSDKPGKDCNVTCKQLITDDISKASTCAKKIFQRHGFDAWYGWKNKCRGKPLPDISSCKK